jgi:ABC-type dipeptide/oligopeptide/nickel transport system ATPase subunit
MASTSIDTSSSKARENVNMNKSAPRIATPKTDKIEEIIDRAHSYEIYEEGIGRYRFVDRDNEIRKILKSSEYLFLGGRITVLYGPKGCGKSTLFKAVSHAVKDSDFEAILIARVIATMPGSMWEGVKSLTLSPEISVLGAATSIAMAVGDAIMNEKIDKNKKIFIVADEVRADSPEHLSSFKQWLEGFTNRLRKINGEIVEKGGRGIAVIALTSDALVAELRYVVGRKVDWALMWNLPRNASEEHISQIGLQHRVARELGIGAKEAREILWRLAGGNPRALGIIWKERIKGWLRDEVINGIKKFTQDLPKKQRRKALEEISTSLDKVDDIGWTDPSIWKAMLRHNIIIYIASSKEISEMPREQWIGREYAFQIPAYYHALKAMARKRSTDIEPEEVIREAMG